MGLPCAVIAGRPNVGKSTLFNTLAHRRIAIVDPTSGVTRDRIATTILHGDSAFELIDTGGMGSLTADQLGNEVQRQIDIALRTADAVLFVVDVKAGLLPMDHEIADRLRRLEKPVILVANKCDHPTSDKHAADSCSLGLGDPMPVSATRGRGRNDLLDAIAGHLPKFEPPESRGAHAMKLAIVGKRNVGKSTFINSLAGEDRVIVSETPGTTRDCIDVTFEMNNRQFIAIDTAGVMKRSKANSIEFYSMVRAEASIRRADMVLLLLASAADVSKVDKQLARYITDHHKPCIVVVNKWDLAQGVLTGAFDEYLGKTLPGLGYAPVSFTSAISGHNVGATIELAMSLHKQSGIRVPTGQLNQAIEDTFRRRRPKTKGSRTPKIYYGTQVGIHPPQIVLFVNDPILFSASYRRYVENSFRKILPFGEIPIRVRFAVSGEDRFPKG